MNGTLEIIVIVVSAVVIAAFAGGWAWLIFAPWNKTRNHAAFEQARYPAPSDISYDEDSRWCQDHGHTGLLVSGPGLTSCCDICDHLVNTDPRFAAALCDHNPDGSRRVAGYEGDYEARWDAHCAKVVDQLREMQPGEQWTPIPLPGADDVHP